MPSGEGRVEILPLDRRHNAQMLAILRESPIESGGLSICFDRQPDIFTMAELKYAPVTYGGFFVDGELVGFGMAGCHPAYVDGRVETVCHYSDAYILEAFRHRGLIGKSLPFFLAATPREARIGYAIIMRGNRAAEAMLGGRIVERPGVPKTRIVGGLEVRNIVVTLGKKERTGLAVRQARLSDVEGIVALLQAEHAPRLFGLVVDRDRFAARLQRPGMGIERYLVVEEGGRLTGVCAAWDTSPFKQDRVVRYRAGLKALRLLNNLAAPLLGFARLPPAGGYLRDVFVTDWAVQGRSPVRMRALLERVYNQSREQKYNSVIFGSCEGDPLLEAARGFQTAKVASHVIQLGGAEGGKEPHLPFIDIALL